ncbi:hypothetical protein Cgig2_010261 [Carnegiea gigantea]|uniref:ABC1 atypical kinase-like domain-containing protein n=1 Tax=Carnegiea gigantea TaxID=171969 RepID=A0A9Q1KDQ1_9CARY|nr:hypothetical protein Cgig2_010261 [Carnegiea gigantea]
MEKWQHTSRNLKLIAEYFQNSESLGGPSRDWVGIYEECATRTAMSVKNLSLSDLCNLKQNRKEKKKRKENKETNHRFSQFGSESELLSQECKSSWAIDIVYLLAFDFSNVVRILTLLLSCRILYQEIDYINEGKNADRFRRDFRNIKWVRVPLVYWDYTASKVLTLEYVPGIKINELDKLDAQGFNRSQIASRAIEAYLIQMLKTGFFHADPHPGNLAIDKDQAIIYYDFGMMGEIKTFTRERLLDLFYAVYEKDAKKDITEIIFFVRLPTDELRTTQVVNSLIDLGALQPTGDLSVVRRSIKFFLDNLLSQTPDQQQTLAAIGEV